LGLVQFYGVGSIQKYVFCYCFFTSAADNKPTKYKRMDAMSSSGVVKWLDNTKGFGFIKPEAWGNDIFVHYFSIKGGGYKTLNEEQSVTYEAEQGPKGHHAAEVLIKS